MLFSDVIDHQKVKEALLQAVWENRLSHALLFLAPEGAGGLPLALALAQYVVCSNKKENESCGQCAGCKKAAQMIHPDIHYSYPVIPKKPGDKPVSADYGAEWRNFVLNHPYGNAYDWLQFIGAENKQGNISAQECQEMIRKLSLKSYESDHKIMIIWRPEYLGKEGNRLLKLLEEPPAKTLFILVAEQADQILNTILSRTQLIKITPLAASALTQALIERKNIDQQQAQRIATLAEGSYRTALQLTQHNTTDFLTYLREWMNAIFLGNALKMQKWIDHTAGAKTGRETQKQFLRYFINLLEYALRLQHLAPEQVQMAEDEKEFIMRLNKRADFFQLKEIIRLLDDACYHIERNANSKILFHALSIQLQYIFAKQPLPLA